MVASASKKGGKPKQLTTAEKDLMFKEKPKTQKGKQRNGSPQACSDQINRLGGTFTARNRGISGQVELEQYPNDVNCRHVVQTDCSNIIISYVDIAVEVGFSYNYDTQSRYPHCDYDNFWFEVNGNRITDKNCYCHGEGCVWHEIPGQWFEQEDYFGDSAEIEINSDSFTFAFQSDGSKDGGHIIFYWQCADDYANDATAPYHTDGYVATATATTTGTTEQPQCSDEIPFLGGRFETTENGSSGQIKLNRYPNSANCQHFVPRKPEHHNRKPKFLSPRGSTLFVSVNRLDKRRGLE